MIFEKLNPAQASFAEKHAHLAMAELMQLALAVKHNQRHSHPNPLPLQVCWLSYINAPNNAYLTSPG